MMRHIYLFIVIVFGTACAVTIYYLGAESQPQHSTTEYAVRQSQPEIQPELPELKNDEQVSFGLEEELQHPAEIPETVLRLLNRDEDVRRCLKEESSRVDGNGKNDISGWFEAAAVDLNNDNHMDYIVKAANPCLWGANIGPFWVFLSTKNGHKLVLTAHNHELSVLKTTTNSCCDIRTDAASAVAAYIRVYKFDRTKYRQSDFRCEYIAGE